MQIKELMDYAIQNNSKIQQQTYKLSKEDLKALIDILYRVRRRNPNVHNCNEIRNAAPFIIDNDMRDIYNILATSDAQKEINVYVVLNFTWKHAVGSVAVGRMNLIVSYEGRGHKVLCCVASKNNILLDDILPQNLQLVKKYAFAKDIVGSKMDEIIEKTRGFFEDAATMTEAKLNEMVSLLDTKTFDRRIYMGLGIFTKKQQEADFWVVKLNISYKTQAYHFSFETKLEDRKYVNLLEQKLLKRSKNSIQKMRSYATKMDLPIFEKTYYENETQIDEFQSLFSNVIWNNVGLLIFDMKKHWDSLPPYLGVLPIHVAVCQEENIFHVSLWIPSAANLMVESYMVILAKHLQTFRRDFFPDDRYKASIRRYALNPSVEVKQEDKFLMPYIYSMRYNIISENVRNPSNKNVPSNLSGSINQWRQYYKKKLQQHLQRHPKSMDVLGLHDAYKQEIVKALKQKQKQKAIHHFVYQEPLKQVPMDHAYRQEILEKRKQLKQEYQQFQTVEDVVESIWTDLNLIDPIRSTVIENPVRSPYLQSGIYQQQSIRQWLSKGGLRLDPLSRKQMPRHFQPRVDDKIKNLITQVQEKIDKILQNQQDNSSVKKLRLWLLKKELEKQRVFQQIIKTKN